MNQSFKLKYDQMREGNPTNEDTSSESHTKAYGESYSKESHVRNICFVWLDGKRIFMNYSYLVSGEYCPDDNTITLSFTTQTFVLGGVNLESLFYDLMQHMAKQITCTDSRYNLTGEDETPVVNTILIKKDS